MREVRWTDDCRIAAKGGRMSCLRWDQGIKGSRVRSCDLGDDDCLSVVVCMC